MSYDSTHVCLNPVRLPQTGIDAAIFRCGKCPDCLKNKANQLAVRLYREMESCKRLARVWFLTFTYDDEHLPVLVTDFKLISESGEIVVSRQWFADSYYRKLFLDNAPFEWRSCYKKGKLVRARRYFPLDLHSVFGYTSLYQSVNYEHFKLMMKRVRHKIDDFSFMAVPEYGGLGYRPHIHAVFVGIDSSDVRTIVDNWPYGHVDVDCLGVDPRSRDSQFSKVSTYLSKYATKGSYDCPFIGLYCHRCRRSSSINFGVGDLFSLRSYLLAFDKYGEYDVSSPPSCVSPELLSSRKVYSINGYNYPFPNYLYRKVFNVKFIVYDSCTQKNFVRYRASELQKQTSSFVLKRALANLQRESAKVLSRFKTVDALSGYYSSIEDYRTLRLLAAERQLRFEIEQSIF